MDRSGAVAQGLSAINTYIGENDPADYVRYVRNDLMGITRDDLVYDVGRHVDDSVHLFEEWGLPIWKTEPTACARGAESIREGSRAQGRRQAGALRQVADHDQRRILQVDRRRSREEGAGHGRASRSACSSCKLVNDKNDPIARRRRRRVLGAREQDLRLQVQGLPAGRAAARERVPSALRRRRHGPRLVPGVERRLDLRHGGRGRRRDDHDGKPLRAGPLQGRLRPGRRLVPAVQGQGDQRLGRGLHDQEQGACSTEYRLTAGGGARLVPAQPSDAEGDEGRSRPDLHGYRQCAGQAARDHDAEGGQAPRGRGLGGLPRHVHRPVRRLGRREHRARQEDLRADADRALPARLALRLRGIWVSGPEDLGAPNAVDGEYDGVPAHLPRGGTGAIAR